MTHIQSLMIEATQYRMLRDVFRRDPDIGPDSAAIMRDVFRAGGEDCDASPRQREMVPTIRG
jgi:hypothetical protein